jgi:hypothetical protein
MPWQRVGESQRPGAVMMDLRVITPGYHSDRPAPFIFTETMESILAGLADWLRVVCLFHLNKNLPHAMKIMFTDRNASTSTQSAVALD